MYTEDYAAKPPSRAFPYRKSNLKHLSDRHLPAKNLISVSRGAKTATLIPEQRCRNIPIRKTPCQAPIFSKQTNTRLTSIIQWARPPLFCYEASYSSRLTVRRAVINPDQYADRKTKASVAPKPRIMQSDQALGISWYIPGAADEPAGGDSSEFPILHHHLSVHDDM